MYFGTTFGGTKLSAQLAGDTGVGKTALHKNLTSVGGWDKAQSTRPSASLAGPRASPCSPSRPFVGEFLPLNRCRVLASPFWSSVSLRELLPGTRVYDLVPFIAQT